MRHQNIPLSCVRNRTLFPYHGYLNLTGVFLCSKYILPLMKTSGKGAIINHASIDALLGNPNVAAYSAAKGGINATTQSLAMEYGDREAQPEATPGGKRERKG